MEHTLLQLYITVMCKYSYCLVAFCIEQCLNQWLKEVYKMVDDGIVLPWLAKFVEISVIIAGNFEAAEYFGRQLTGDIFLRCRFVEKIFGRERLCFTGMVQI